MSEEVKEIIEKTKKTDMEEEKTSRLSIKKKKLPNDEIATFCDQMALILESGIPLYDGIYTLAESTSDEVSKEAFDSIAKKVEETGSLYTAVKEAGYFPEYMVSMINIGEQTGKLDEVLISLSEYYDRDYKIGKAIKSAISYPVILIAMMSAVVILLVVKVIPIFNDIFKNLGSDVSESANAVMKSATMLGYFIFGITIIILLIILSVYIYNISGNGDKLRNLCYKLPGLRKITRKISAARFASVIGMMLESGYSIEKSLELAPSVVSNNDVKEKINECKKLVDEGKPFTEALGEMGIFDPLACRMITVGFKAGKLDSVLKKLSKQYNEEIDSSIEKVVSIIEPTLVAIMSLIIGGILISVMLPLANIMSSIG